MNKVLITGFEPFGGEKINPSWEVVKRLDNQQIAGRQVIALQLPCVFGASLQLLSQQIDALKPELVIAVGQAGGRPDVTIERVAINVDDARIADNHGQQPIDQPVIAGGPAAYFSRLPIKAMVEALRQAGIPASVSQTAGTYVCNHVMYGLLAHIEPLVGVKGGFIHIPYLPEQAAWQNNTPSMSLAVLVEALSLAIETALLAEEDIAVRGGATH